MPSASWVAGAAAGSSASSDETAATNAHTATSRNGQVTEAVRINTEGRSRALRICFLALTASPWLRFFPPAVCRDMMRPHSLGAADEREPGGIV
jgi:hypothetical protein